MGTVTSDSAVPRVALAAQRGALDEILHRYGATNPRLVGSVARGDAIACSDIDLDLLVDLLPDRATFLMRVVGIGEDLSEAHGRRVDVDIIRTLLYDEVSSTARRPRCRFDPVEQGRVCDIQHAIERCKEHNPRTAL